MAGSSLLAELKLYVYCMHFFFIIIIVFQTVHASESRRNKYEIQYYYLSTPRNLSVVTRCNQSYDERDIIKYFARSSSIACALKLFIYASVNCKRPWRGPV